MSSWCHNREGGLKKKPNFVSPDMWMTPYQKWVNKVGDLKMCTEKLYTRNKKMWKKIIPQTLWVWLWFLWLECNYKQLYGMHNVYLFSPSYWNKFVELYSWIIAFSSCVWSHVWSSLWERESNLKQKLCIEHLNSFLWKWSLQLFGLSKNIFSAKWKRYRRN